VITRPSTSQIILDCRRELLEVIKPAVDSEAAQVSIDMLENVLRNCATRADHEIAWMAEETSTMATYAQAVETAGHRTETLTAALAAAAADDTVGLDLAAVTHRYALAGEAFSCALEAAIAAGEDSLTAQAADLLQRRVDRELEVMGEWGFVGRG
jgi:hypothetical protein